MKWPRHPKYKPSGVEWIGDVPEHWAVKRGRFCMDVNPRSNRLRTLRGEDEVSFVPMEAVGEYGGLRLEQTRTVDEVGSGYTEFDDGDVVVAKITPCFENGKGALASGLVNGAAFGTTELHVLRAASTLDQRFLFYVTISRWFRSTGEGDMYGAGGQKRVPPEFCENARIPLPPIGDQRKIAEFLDRETAKIDTLVKKKRTLIARLKEKRTALISRTVTRGLPPDAACAAGLDPHPKLKPSGIDWLGDVPEHWTPKRLRFISPQITVGIVVEPSKYYEDEGIPCLRSLNVRPNALLDRDLVYISAESHRALSKSMLNKGDLVAVRSGQPGTTAVVDDRFDGANCIDLIIIRKPKTGHSAFISYFLNSLPAQAQFTGGAGGAIQQHFNITTAADLWLIEPPPDEQEMVADFLDRETAKIDAMIAKVETAIDRLQEYRTALITAAVTGKIDLRAKNHIA